MVIQKIIVCGAGTMGSGIAQIAAQRGFKVVQFDLNETAIEKSKQQIELSLKALVLKEKLTPQKQVEVFNNIHFTSDLEDCCGDLIIEAIIENKDVKVGLFQSLMQLNTGSTIYVTNTSSISVNAISKAINSPKQFAGLHFFNPATIMKLVEVIKTENTSEETIDVLIQFVQQLEKTPVVCKDAPGFIVNRVARHYYLEAMKLLELNIATIENIDTVMEATGFKMGPFKLMDLIGLDINYNVSQIIWNDLNEPERLKPSIIQQQKVAANKLGKKTGEGFYQY
jgi:3-hydroxybutyryl-CoA dehydrogenase